MYPGLKKITNIKPKQYYRRYVFGSAVYSDAPADIDIAIIYDEKAISVKDAVEYKREIREHLSLLLSMDIDIILLSQKEEEEMCFLKNAKHILF